MNSQYGQIPPERILDIMTAEYEALREARALVHTSSNNSANLFFAAISGATIAFTLIGQLSGVGETLFLTGLVVLSASLLLGLVTFVRVLEGHIANRVYIRGMNRIRRYFVELAPIVADYVILPVNDDVPTFLSVDFAPSRWAILLSAAGTIAIINSIVGSVLIGILMRVASCLPTLLSILVGSVVFIVMFIAHQRYQVRRLQKAEKETEIRFPSTQTHE